MPETQFPPREAPMPSGDQFQEIQDSPEFQELRSRLRRFVFPMSAVFDPRAEAIRDKFEGGAE